MILRFQVRGLRLRRRRNVYVSCRFNPQLLGPPANPTRGGRYEGHKLHTSVAWGCDATRLALRHVAPLIRTAGVESSRYVYTYIYAYIFIYIYISCTPASLGAAMLPGWLCATSRPSSAWRLRGIYYIYIHIYIYIYIYIIFFFFLSGTQTAYQLRVGLRYYAASFAPRRSPHPH